MKDHAPITFQISDLQIAKSQSRQLDLRWRSQKPSLTDLRLQPPKALNFRSQISQIGISKAVTHRSQIGDLSGPQNSLLGLPSGRESLSGLRRRFALEHPHQTSHEFRRIRIRAPSPARRGDRFSNLNFQMSKPTSLDFRIQNKAPIYSIQNICWILNKRSHFSIHSLGPDKISHLSIHNICWIPNKRSHLSIHCLGPRQVLPSINPQHLLDPQQDSFLCTS